MRELLLRALRRRPLFILASSSLLTLSLHAQTGIIEGVVRDAETSEPLANVTVQVRGSSAAAMTTGNGTFRIADVAAGGHTLVASIIGYRPIEQSVMVKEGTVTSVALGLPSEAVELKGVTAAASRERSYIANVTATATKTSTYLRDIPASIQIVPSIVLKDQGASTLDQSIRNVSGIAQSSQGSYGFFNSYTMRGLRQRFLRDGVPDGPTTNGYARTLTDVDRIEVLKGPGSAIYGSSEPGGSINLVSKPTYAQPALSISQSAGSFGFLRTTVDAGGSLLSNDIRTRVTAAYSRRDGYRGIGNSTVELLPSVSYAPSRDHTLTVSVDYRRIEQDADTYGIPFRGNDLLDVSPERDYHTPFSTTRQDVIRGAVSHLWQAAEGMLVRTNIVVMNRDLYLLRNAGGTIAATSDTMTGRRLRRQSDRGTDLVAQIEPTLRATTGSIGHTILAGAEYLSSAIDAVRGSAALPDITNVLAPVVRESSIEDLTFRTDFDRDISMRQVGIYLQDQMTITDRFKVRVGARWDLFAVDDLHRTDSLGDSRSDGRLSSQAGLVFQPVTGLSLYTGVARGHLSTVSTESARITEPESSTQYELGGKSSFLDGRLQVNIAAFHVTRERFNVTVGTEQLPVGEQRTQGVEIDMSGQPTRAWGLTGNYAYYDAKITGNPADTGAVGRRPIGVPEHTASLWTTYTFQSGTLEGVGFGGGLTYRDAIFLDAHNNRRVDGYVTVDGALFYRTSLLEAQVNIMNAGNSIYFRNGVNSGAIPGEPRNIQASVRLKL